MIDRFDLSVTALEKRIAALEDNQPDNSISQYTLAQLQNKLQTTWQPDAGVLLAPGSVTPDRLDSDLAAQIAGPVVKVAGTQAGPLPLSGTFSLPQSGLWTFVGFASAFTNVAAPIQIGFGIDTTATLAQARLEANEANSHKSLVPAVWSLTLAAGSHTWNVHIDSVQTNTDGNDFFAILAAKSA